MECTGRFGTCWDFRIWVIGYRVSGIGYQVSGSGAGRCGGRKSLASFEENVNDSREEQNRQHGGDLPRGVVAALDHPPVVDDAADGGNVDEAVDALPVFAAHGSQDEGRRGNGQGEKDEPREEADLDEAALERVVDHAGPDELPLCDDFAGMAGAQAGEGGDDVVSREEEDV